MRWNGLIFTATLMTALTACNYNKVKTAPAASTGANFSKTGVPDYSAVQNAVIGPKCLTCHSEAKGNKGGINLEGWRNVQVQLPSVIFETAKAKSMPPEGPLSQGEIDMLTRWANAGAPEKIAVGEKPDEELSTGPNDWSKVRDHVFGNKCEACHTVANPQGGVDVTSFANVKENASRIFDSIFVKASMPIAGLPVLTTGEREVLLDWFNSGMPE